MIPAFVKIRCAVLTLIPKFSAILGTDGLASYAAITLGTELGMQRACGVCPTGSRELLESDYAPLSNGARSSFAPQVSRPPYVGRVPR